MIGIDKQDERILALIGKTPLHPSAIARELGVKRTTITYRLNRLTNLGMLQPIIVGRKSVYEIKYKNTGSKNHVRIYTGKNIVDGYKELLNLPKETVILSVQGSGAVNGELQNLPQSFIMEAHRVFKRKRIILKGLSNKRSFDAFDKLEKSLVQSHIGRSLGLKVFNNNTFTGDGEIMVTKHLLLLANPKKMRVITIKDDGILEIIYDILVSLFDLLEDAPTFDLNSHLEKTYPLVD